jgi:uncharacterized SAM-binding protein YcdF (DUF218 family)
MLYRFIVTLLQPFPLCYLLTLVALVRLWRARRMDRRLLSLAIVPFALLGIASLPAVAFLAVASLERQYPPQAAAATDAAPIVVLAGYVRPPGEAAPQAELGADTLLRCLHAAELYRARPRLVLVSGGRAVPADVGPSLARSMRDFLVAQGVREEHLLMEEESGSTYENALLSGDLLTQRGISRIVLVTSASHLPRGTGCFRALGFSVVPSPCDCHTVRAGWGPGDFLLPNARAAAETELAVHEWLGLAWYWLCGRI